jgi:hypothetical protein
MDPAVAREICRAAVNMPKRQKHVNLRNAIRNTDHRSENDRNVTSPRPSRRGFRPATQLDLAPYSPYSRVDPMWPLCVGGQSGALKDNLFEVFSDPCR